MKLLQQEASTTYRVLNCVECSIDEIPPLFDSSLHFLEFKALGSEHPQKEAALTSCA